MISIPLDEYRALIAHFEKTAPTSYGIRRELPPDVSSVTELNVRDIRLGEAITRRILTGATPSTPLVWDLRKARVAETSTAAEAALSNKNCFARGWSQYSQQYPQRALPSYADRILRQLTIPRRANHNNNTRHADPSYSGRSDSSPLLDTTVTKRKMFGGKGLLFTRKSLAYLADDLAIEQESERKLNAKLLHALPQTLCDVMDGDAPHLETGDVTSSSLAVIEADPEGLNQIVYDHLLIASDFFLGLNARDSAAQVLLKMKPALAISDALHQQAVSALTPEKYAALVTTSSNLVDHQFDNAVLGDIVPLSVDFWRGVRGALVSSPSVEDGELEEDSRQRYLERADSLIAVFDEVNNQRDAPYPPHLAALLYAAALQPLYTVDPLKPVVDEADIESLLDHLARRLQLKQHTSVFPFCRFHALMLANRNASERDDAAVQCEFFDSLAEMVEGLLPDIDQLVTVPIDNSVQGCIALYKLHVLQEAIENTFVPLQWFDSLGFTDPHGQLRASILRAFVQVCRVAPPVLTTLVLQNDRQPLLLRLVSMTPQEVLTLPPAQCRPRLIVELMSTMCRLTSEKGTTTFAALLTAPDATAVRIVDALDQVLGASCNVLRCSVTDLLGSEMSETFLVPGAIRVFGVAMSTFWRRPLESQTVPQDFLPTMDAFRECLFKRMQAFISTSTNQSEFMAHPPFHQSLRDALKHLIEKSIEKNLQWIAAFYERHLDHVTERLLAATDTMRSGSDETAVLQVVQECVGTLRSAIVGPQTFQELATRSLVPAINFVGRLARELCGVYLLPSTQTAAGATTATATTVPQAIGIAQRILANGKAQADRAAALNPDDVLQRLKRLNSLKGVLIDVVQQFALHEERVVQMCLSPQSAVSIRLSESGLLLPLLEEVGRNMSRFSSDLTETLAIRTVYSGSLLGILQEEFLRIDIKYYRTQKYNKKLLATDRNAHMKPMFPHVTTAYLLERIEAELVPIASKVDADSTMIRLNAHVYAHLAALLASILVLSDPEEDRYFYPEQGKVLHDDVTQIRCFFTKNVPEVTEDFCGPLAVLHRSEGGGSATDLSKQVRESCGSSTKWWAAGEAIVEYLLAVLAMPFQVPSEELLNGTVSAKDGASAAGGGGFGVAPYHTLPEVSDGPYCRFIVRSILVHRKDPAAKKFVKSLS